MHPDLPKPVKRKLRELVGAAYEAALRQELLKLREEFARWERGEIDGFELTERIHKFHDGPARELYKLYASPSTADLAMIVAGAVHSKLIDGASIPDDVKPHVWEWLPRSEDE
jgi:hypothetical protein